MAAFRLPVSGLDVEFRQTTGMEDIRLAEETVLDTALALTILSALGRLRDGGSVPWADLTPTDADAALLAMRRSYLGDLMRSSIVCGGARQHVRQHDGAAGRCGARIDISFRVTDYLAHHAPPLAAAPEATPDATPGWFPLADTGVTYRLVTCADQLFVAGRRDAAQELARRCIRPAPVPAAIRRRVETAVARRAPDLYDDLEGICPECGAAVRIAFDPQRYVLGELRERALFVFEEVHMLAAHYRWREADILALPGVRRARYAEFVADAWAAH